MKPDRTLLFIPTYNEKENVERILAEILRLGLDLDILFLDDNSPDGTGKLLDGLAEKHPNLRVIHRSEKLGIGSAHLAGIRWAYDHGYSRLITMDCDFSHPPEYLPDFIEGSRTHDVVVGSRYLLDESLKEWNLFRKAITHVGHLLTRYLLGMPYDASGAFRFYRLDRIPREAFDRVRSMGYSFFFESLFILHANRFSIKEVPIHLPARTYGHSKMSLSEALQSLKRLFRIYTTTLFNRKRHILPKAETGSFKSADDQKEWDLYWSDRKKGGGRLYDLVAEFYRVYIIKRTLNHFVDKHFRRNARVLHAGCGSGRVDTDVASRVSVAAIDFSVPALRIYRGIHQDSSQIFCGDILGLPVRSESLDGVYNLGVMEHFTATEIRTILLEFNRILKPDGKILLFWPPEFGLSVMFLKFVHFFLNNVLGKNVKLHPDETTRVRSRRHVREMIEDAGFSVIEYYFGVRDLFTYSVIVASKSSHPRSGEREAATATCNGPG
jgi:dolichol-phosphate mannosyltransferase